MSFPLSVLSKTQYEWSEVLIGNLGSLQEWDVAFMPCYLLKSFISSLIQSKDSDEMPLSAAYIGVKWIRLQYLRRKVFPKSVSLHCTVLQSLKDKKLFSVKEKGWSEILTPKIDIVLYLQIGNVTWSKMMIKCMCGAKITGKEWCAQMI